MTRRMVRVWLRAEVEVEMEIYVSPGESSTDLTDAEQQKARLLANRAGTPEWDVYRVREESTT